MTAFRRILCPVDLSSFSRRALRRAMELGRAPGTSVTMLSVHEGRPSSTVGDTLPPQTAEELVAFAREASGSTPDKVIVTSGQPAPEIIRVAHDIAADLIVMGTHGLSGFERLLLGSVTEKVLRKVDCPVLTVPRLVPDTPESPEAAFGTIVCGVDRSATSRRALEHALALARQSRGQLVAVHVLEDISAEEPQFASHFNTPECWREIEPAIRATYEALIPPEARAAISVEILTPIGKPNREIVRIAAERGASLIVLGTTGWYAPFGATTQHVLRDADCPVLVVPPAPDAAPGG